MDWLERCYLFDLLVCDLRYCSDSLHSCVCNVCQFLDWYCTKHVIIRTYF